MMFKLLVLIFSFGVISRNEAARILAVFPTPSISHQVSFRPLIHELVRRGHEVVVITADPAFPQGQKPENLTEIDVHDLSYNYLAQNFRLENYEKGWKHQWRVIYDLMSSIFEMQMELEEIQKIIKKETKPFDLILVEAYFQTTLGFSHIYKVPVIQISTGLPMYVDLEIMGTTDHPLLYPAMGCHKLDNLGIFEKIKELFDHYIIYRGIKSYADVYDSSLKRIFGTDTPPIKELYKNIDMLFVNALHIWDSNRPVPQSIQYFGGIHVNPVKELPQDLKSYLDSSKHGVIYISFGTNVSPSALPPNKIQTFINVLSRLPYDVLWKWDRDELPGRSDNIRISKWFPQSDLLRHPKINFFITQGGLQSTDEAIVAGVPLLGIPMLGDQWYNTAMYLRHKIGVKIELEDLSDKTLKEAIDVLTKDDTYHRNIKKFRDIVYDQPQRPIERAVWWTEHVLRHGGARHLRSPAANLSWTEYYEVELLAYALLTATSVISLFLFVIYKLGKLFLGGGNIKLKHS